MAFDQTCRIKEDASVVDGPRGADAALSVDRTPPHQPAGVGVQGEGPPPVRPDNRTPEGAIVLTNTTSTAGGVIAGKRDGNFNYYWLDYPGGPAGRG